MNPVPAWTPAEAWLGVELARHGLKAQIDGGPPRFAAFDEGAEGEPFFTEREVTDAEVRMVVHLRCRAAWLWLDPPVLSGARWRRDWVLELSRGPGEVWVVSANQPAVAIDDPGSGPLVGRLRVRKRFFEGGAGAMAVRARLEDRAFHRHTRQSSAVAKPLLHPFRWAAPTAEEKAPYWDADLGAVYFVPSFTLDLRGLVEDTLVRVRAYAYPSPSKGAPAGCPSIELTRADGATDAEGTTRFTLDAKWVARYVRVELAHPAGKPVALTVAGTEAHGAELFGETLRETWRRAFAFFGERTMVLARERDDGAYEPRQSYAEVGALVEGLARALGARIEPTQPEAERVFVALATRNRIEWVVADVACVERGYVTVPLAPRESEERIANILERCKPAVLFVDAEDLDAMTALAKRACPALRLLVVCGAPAGSAIEPSDGIARVRFEDLAREGASVQAPKARAYSEDDLCTVLFTSGSTGAPKGAMRTYRAVHAMLRSYGVPQPALHLSFQPLSHVSERMYLPAVFLNGGSVAFSRGAAHLRSELRAFAPTELGSVPRLYDLLYAEFQRRVREAEQGLDLEKRTRIAHARAEARAAFGDRLMVLGIGSAPVSPEVLGFLRETFSDIWVVEGYGTTEVGTIANDGRTVPEVQVKLVPVEGERGGRHERGEIWVRTPHIIAGYFGDPKATAAALDAEGYFRTGDLGERAPDGSVRVIGRRQSAVKLANGEFVAPERIEGAVATAPLVDRVFVHAAPGAVGVAALVFPRREELAVRLGLAGESALEALVAHPSAAHEVRSELRRRGREAGLAEYELPAHVVLEAETPTVENGALTTNGKLARAALARRYEARLTSHVEPEKLGQNTAPSSELSPELDRMVRAVSELLGRPVTADEPLMDGLDSLAAASVLAALGDTLGRPVALHDWFASRSLAQLAARVFSSAAPARSALDDEALRELARPALTAPIARVVHATLASVLLTGATGFLGIHLLEAILRDTALRVVCLVRGSSNEAALERLRRVAARAGADVAFDARVRVVAGDLAAPHFGLDEGSFEALAASVDAVLHAGAVVSWMAPYAALRGANVEGTRTVLALATAGGRARPVHFVSTISTAPADGDERSVLTRAHAVASSPYALSKWLAETITRSAATQGLPVAVYRPAMIAPHSARGAGNAGDFIHRYMTGCASLGRYIDRDDARLDMTPVDFVARAIVALLVADPHPEAVTTTHLVNVEQSLTYAALGRAMNAAGAPMEPSDYDAFRAAVLERGERSEALRALAAYFPAEGFTLGMGPWPSEQSRQRLEALGVECPAIDVEMIGRFVAAMLRRDGTKG